jgi:predicted amidophosphoribosyltransferase
MALRVFRCRQCGHKMRITGPRCGRCYSKKEIVQTLWFWLGVVVLCVLGAGLIFAGG